MSDIIVAVRPLLEVLYFLSGVLLLVGLWITYNQLIAIKKESQQKAERASKEKAIEAANAYVSRFVDAANTEFKARNEAKISGQKPENVDFNSFVIDANGWLSSEDSEVVLGLCVRSVNELEAVAAYFTTGVADEATGFGIIGRSFCYSVEYRADVITLMRGADAHPNYQSTVRLYEMWRPRIESSEIDRDIERMKGEIAKLAQRKKGR